MIDYVLKDPKIPNNTSINIEHMNLYPEKFFDQNQNNQPNNLMDHLSSPSKFNTNFTTQNENAPNLVLNIYKTGYKYPYICSEILSSEVQVILDKIIPISDIQNLEESKSYVLNLSTDSINNTMSGKKEDKDEDIQVILYGIDEIKREPNFLFNPPEIEYGFEKEKEKLEKEKELNNTSIRDISFNMSIDRKYTMTNLETFEILDYILSFLATGMNNMEYNALQSSYFAKIIISILRSSKCNFFIRYICNRKPEILINLINNVHLYPVCEILVKLLSIENILLDENLNFENIKISILNRLISKFYSGNSTIINNHLSISEEIIFSNISAMLIDYAENTKNLDALLSESFLNSLNSLLGLIKNRYAIKEILNFCVVLLKQFKFEYEKAYKFVSSISLSKYFY
jgi:hypothetical protein